MTFTIKTTLKASTKDIYNAWLSSKGHSSMTGADATVSNKVGGSFTTWDGYIFGKNSLLEPNRKIVQSWRTTDFNDDDEDSQIEITFKEVKDETELILVHSHLPKDGEKYKKGWEDFYFSPMKAYFSKK